MQPPHSGVKPSAGAFPLVREGEGPLWRPPAMLPVVPAVLGGAADMSDVELQQRAGQRPETTRPAHDRPMPHQQLSQNAPVALQQDLVRRAAALPGVIVADSKVSVPGARAFHLDESRALGPAAAFQRDREFAHVHPPHDGSLHLTLPPDVYAHVLEAGWGEPHPISGTMMVFGPRDAHELEVVWSLLQTSYGWASGRA
jgi:hypothetical protein